MKTTIDIADNIMERSRRLARRDHVTFRALVEEGLRLLLAGREKKAPYRARPVVFRGKGLTPEFRNASWEQIRDAIYKGHGA